MNSLHSFSMYESWESQRERFERSLNICIPRNHFRSPISVIVKCLFKDEVIWLTASVSLFRKAKTTSSTKKKQTIPPLIMTQGSCGISIKPRLRSTDENFICQINGDLLSPYSALLSLAILPGWP